MGWVPSKDSVKARLKRGTIPTTVLEGPRYKFYMVLINLGVGLGVFVATWAAVTYLFTKKFAGISFLNKS